MRGVLRAAALLVGLASVGPASADPPGPVFGLACGRAYAPDGRRAGLVLGRVPGGALVDRGPGRAPVVVRGRRAGPVVCDPALGDPPRLPRSGWSAGPAGHDPASRY